MAQAVVDDLEAVQIHVKHGVSEVFAPRRGFDAVAEPVEKQDAIGQAGERVVQRIEDELFLGPFTLRVIGLRADHSVGDAVVVANRKPPANHPPIIALGILDAVLAFEMRRLRILVRVQLGDHAGLVVGMDAIDPFHRVAADRLVVEAEHRLPAGREIDLVILEVPVPEAVVGAMRDQAVAFLADLQFAEGRRGAQDEVELVRQ